MSVNRPTRLPIVPIPYPLVLLPGARLTIPIPQRIGDALLHAQEGSGGGGRGLPVVAAVPCSPPEDHEKDSEVVIGDKGTEGKPGIVTKEKWGTATRILRLVRPPPSFTKSAKGGSPQVYLASVHALTRVRLEEPYDASAALTSALHDGDRDMKLLNVSYPPLAPYEKDREEEAREAVVKFKAAALRVLGHLMQNTNGNGKKDAYVKVAGMLEELRAPTVSESPTNREQEENRETLDRAAWMADLLIGSILPGANAGEGEEWADKYALLHQPTPLLRLQLSTTILTKMHTKLEVTTRIAHAVDESLSKQQKEFFLRQQMRAIEKELRELQSPQSNSTVTRRDDRDAHDGQSELDLDPSETEDVELSEIKRKIEAMDPGSEERKAGVREWRRLRRLTSGSGAGGSGGGGSMSVEGSVVRGWLEWFTALPWPGTLPQENSENASASTKSFLAAARAQLDNDHYGLDKIKKRLIEYLAVVRLGELRVLSEANGTGAIEAGSQIEPKDEVKGKELILRKPDPPAPPKPNQRKRKTHVKGPILLFAGPPGTGKTSLGQSIARALKRPFQRVSLGGVRDEAEIRGHRRTYVASGPGLIVQALRKAGRPDFVCLLDEIDKLGGGVGSLHGDPGAALLEVLDPEQNVSFMDHYVNVPIDLSQVLWICTANTLETISAPLLDRCEVVRLAGYTPLEKTHIARRFLLPKQLKANSMAEHLVDITDEAMKAIVEKYTHEAGVRNLERQLGGVVRWKVVEWAEEMDTPRVASEGQESDAAATASTLEEQAEDPLADLEAILGIARIDEEEQDRGAPRRGVVYGLVVMGQGEGGILPVEAVLVPGAAEGGGRLRTTGSLGEVIKESAELALSWVKTRAYDLGITTARYTDPLKGRGDVHLHLPAGAQRKDGPSAGVTMTCALVSLLTGNCVRTDVAMTGEITLRGRVTPVGGIKEKVLGAHRAQIRKVILPYANRKDVEHDVPIEIRNQMEFVFVRNLEETLEAAFGPGVIGWRRGDGMGVMGMVESRL
ncbi:atp-dependent protease la 2 [Moniliophthora roreri MCA 2997]|uniref:Atp-dependent protease la 2 n=1 Tax=Moniliophthora roreri (strain MCA 2997) TaxID=1381753 RepID=V2WCZ4_MONRO|nr:atp-dependent protease la 2 [Moniliophthora roreri MCA 2997]